MGSPLAGAPGASLQPASLEAADGEGPAAGAGVSVGVLGAQRGAQTGGGVALGLSPWEPGSWGQYGCLQRGAQRQAAEDGGTVLGLIIPVGTPVLGGTRNAGLKAACEPCGLFSGHTYKGKLCQGSECVQARKRKETISGCDCPRGFRVVASTV